MAAELPSRQSKFGEIALGLRDLSCAIKDSRGAMKTILHPQVPCLDDTKTCAKQHKCALGNTGQESLRSGRSYRGWTIEDSIASKTLGGEDSGGEVIYVSLDEGNSLPLEGWWPCEPEAPPALLIMGSCLWDCRWQLEFGARGKGNPPARKSLSLTALREEAFKRLDQGHIATRVHIPNGLGKYHSRLLASQVEAAQRMKPEQIVYHLARCEYHLYIAEVEKHLGQKLPQVHDLLDEFVGELKVAVERALKPYTGSLRFIEPIEEFGVSDQIESYLYPYLHAEDFGVPIERVAAVEDLVELTLGYTAWRRCGRLIPVFCGVLELPENPYYSRDLREGEYTTVELTNPPYPSRLSAKKRNKCSAPRADTTNTTTTTAISTGATAAAAATATAAPPRPPPPSSPPHP